MIAVRERKDSYLSSFSAFEERLSEDARSPLKQVRRAALERFAELGFPTLKDEEWRFTNLAPLTKIAFELGNPDGADLTGTHRRQRSDGVLVCRLEEALSRHWNLIEPHLAKYADYQNQAFTALNTAFLRDGAFVYIPPGTIAKEPIYLPFVTKASSKPLVWHRRCLIVAGTGSQAQIVESYNGTEGVYFTNAVTEVVAAENVNLDYYRLQQESEQAFHIATVQVRQDHGSKFTSHTIAQGGALARTNLNVVLDAEDCECTLNGLYLASGDQVVDNHTHIDHARPHCASHELYKGILDGQARGVFKGKIHVHPDAQKTDAKQSNQTLLLSDTATIDSQPQLEIYADDVKCTHGASVGQLDEEQIYYLRTRGLGREAARQLLTYAFANDVISRIRIDRLRSQLEKTLLEVP